MNQATNTISREQELLLQIVQTWRPSEKPEYRGFRCANCQQYKNEAWYHWLSTGEYKLPVHICNDTCELNFISGRIQIDATKIQQVDRNNFGNSFLYKPETISEFEEIVSSWPDYKEPQLKIFSCDECQKDLDIDSLDGQRKGYHVWWKMPDRQTLAELHFHKECANKLGIE